MHDAKVIEMSNWTSLPGLPHHAVPRTRRELLARAGAGFGALAMAYLLGESRASAADKPSPLSPLAPRPPHYRATAKSIIFLFMEGGPSAIDMFDPKPELTRLSGKPLPA